MKDKQKYEIEKKELNLLIRNGIRFNVERTLWERQKGILGYVRKRISKKETLAFKIEEPTLSTLDRLTAEQIELSLDEKALTSDAGLATARRLAKDHSRRCAKIIAMAVLGSDYEIAIQTKSGVRYSTDEKRLSELTDLFFKVIKPSKLRELVGAIDITSNLGDFCSSIRLMSVSRTTAPARVENKED